MASPRAFAWGATLLAAIAACSHVASPPTSRTDAAAPPPPAASASTPPHPTAPAPLSRDEICARDPDVHASAVAGAAPFKPSPHDHDPDSATAPPLLARDGLCPPPPLSGLCATLDDSDPHDVCAISNENLARTLRQSRGSHGAPGPWAAWDGTTPPQYLDRIDAHLHLTPAEHAKLRANGFVALDRLAYESYASAFHDIFQEQLPLYVGVDPILHAVFRGTERALERIEKKRLKPALTSMLAKLGRGLVQSGGQLDATTLSDLDVYLGVARRLAAGFGWDEEKAKASLLRSEDDEDQIRGLARMGGDLEEATLFGRVRMIDFSQLEPRGHYASNGEDGLADYFRTVMWLSRTEFNLASRSCRSSASPADPDFHAETPREARDALALAELVERSGASVEVAAFEEVYGAFAGKREDVPPAALRKLAAANHFASADPHAGAKLKAALGDAYPRTARTHFMPEGCAVLPAIATLLGPRIVPDVAPLTRVVHDATPDRMSLSAGDLGFVLGHDRGEKYIGDLASFPSLPAALTAARAELAHGARAAHDVYGSWLRAILTLGDAPRGSLPTFMTRDAYADARLNSALVAYGQLRHTFVLAAAQGYDAYGCEIPDAYVEPVPAVYDALLAHVHALQGVAPGWRGLEHVLTALGAIARGEAGGYALNDAERRWLGMVSENVPVGGYADSGEPPKWTGWYFDMFEDRDHGASTGAAFIADYFTLTNAGKVAYVGADEPRLGVFVVDVGGAPRAMVGPVAKGFQAYAPIAPRLDDEHAREPGVAKSAPWRESFAVDPGPEPALGLQATLVQCPTASAAGDAAATPAASLGALGALGALGGPFVERRTGGSWRIALRSDKPAGPVAITLLDHHGDPITAPATLDVGGDYRVAQFDLPGDVAASAYGVEAMHLQVLDLAHAGLGSGPWDFTTSPSVYAGPDGQEDPATARPRGLPPKFAIGGARPPPRVE